MRAVALWVLTLIAGCAPDYGHTAFRCDGELHCPGDQTCVLGRCRRGAPTGDGVVCGAVTCDTTQQCCLDLFNPPRCLAAGELCPGTTALCDGIEDCQASDRCCADDDAVFCDATCDRYACRDAGDCPSTRPNCCASDATPWGTCSEPSC